MQIKSKKSRYLLKLLSVLLALALWQGLSALPSLSILLASPTDVVRRLCTIWRDEGFLRALWFSFSKIASGFLLALVSGVLLAVLASRFKVLEILLSPYMLTIKSIPVASFVIIILIFSKAARLSVVISYLMVLPVIYTNVLTGIQSASRRLDEMATVYHIPWHKRLLYIRTPQTVPYFLSGATVALGLCWKSGIAAELIGIPAGSIGEALYLSKIYLNTTDLFCWTVIIVLISFAFEKTVLSLLKLLFRALEKTV